MPVAIDTSVLIFAERSGEWDHLLPDENTHFYIPAHAAAEFLVGAHLPKSALLRERARKIYENKFKPLVDFAVNNPLFGFARSPEPKSLHFPSASCD